MKSNVSFFIYNAVVLTTLLLVSAGCKKETTSTNDSNDTINSIFTGMVSATLNELQNIPTTETINKNLIPDFRNKNIASNISLDVPFPGSQMPYQSCVAWAVGYGLEGYHFKHIEGHSDYTGWDRVFSPNFIWNQLNGGQDSGISIPSSFNLIKQQGCCKLLDMPLCGPDIQPSSIAKINAAQYKLTEFYRFSNKDINEMKYYISKGYPIVVGMVVDESFLSKSNTQFEKLNDGRLIWKEYKDNNKGTHAMLICGYDDNIMSFKVLNSYGSNWGNDGYFWVTYDFFNEAISAPIGNLFPEIYVGFIKRPILVTKPASQITQYTSKCSGTILSDWGYSVSECGICWSLNHDPTIQDNKVSNNTLIGEFTSEISSLTPNTKYYFKAFAKNSVGVAYGIEDSLTTLSLPLGETVEDIDGNTYQSVIIGAQTWMAENLKTSHYNDGTPIPYVTDYSAWKNLTTPAFCWCNNEFAYKDIYGAQYNFYTVTDNNKLCPSGWHIPSDSEWTDLVNFLGGNEIAGGKMKEVGTSHWVEPNYGATNESGFNGLPSGTLGGDGTNQNVGYFCFFWSSSVDPNMANGGWIYGLYRYSESIGRMGAYSWGGMSVRCIKD